jgi:tetratricopeptide (TPR) repeat protein
MNFARVLLSTLTATWLVLSHHQVIGAEGVATNKKLAEAKLLLDTYYGNQENLRLARTLIESALSIDSGNADVYVQAARLTVMGGHIVRDEFRRNTVESYDALLDKALSIDPSNQKALILKAEAYDLQKNCPEEKAALDKAKALGSSDPWLLMGYARYYYSVRDDTMAHHFYSQVEALGPGSAPEQRKAFVSALSELARFKPPPGQPFRLKELASRARAERYPTDAWTLGNFADEFVFHGMFDDAIVFAREAVRTRNYGAGRLTLAVSLYGKAAQLLSANKTADANKLLSEAQQLGFAASDVLSRLEGSSEQVEALMPILKKIVK